MDPFQRLLVSPPTRGSPPTDAYLQGGFPRPRGDGPIDGGATRLQGTLVSPPTRGWTRLTRRSPRRGDGPRSRRGFPRPRGDGPAAYGARTRHDHCWFPRPRGDGPMDSQRHLVSSSGFPAHAGMDPRRRCRRSVRVSPPTRGWTLRPPSIDRDRVIGFPRPRGDGPKLIGQLTRSGRFPRPRGDGPHDRFFPHHVPSVSPPTRGWTPGCIAGEMRKYDGFPAHAGMDPISLADERWFPRPRGDGPHVYPRGDGCRKGFPRPRGDGPSCEWRQLRPAMVSPPTRGWTQ